MPNWREFSRANARLRELSQPAVLRGRSVFPTRVQKLTHPEPPASSAVRNECTGSSRSAPLPGRCHGTTCSPIACRLLALQRSHSGGMRWPRFPPSAGQTRTYGCRFAGLRGARGRPRGRPARRSSTVVDTAPFPAPPTCLELCRWTAALLPGIARRNVIGTIVPARRSPDAAAASAVRLVPPNSTTARVRVARAAGGAARAAALPRASPPRPTGAMAAPLTAPPPAAVGARRREGTRDGGDRPSALRRPAGARAPSPSPAVPSGRP